MLQSIKVKTDHRGSLIVFENEENLDFVPTRSYILMKNQNNEKRGFHAHKKLNQLIVCLAGSCKIKTIDKNMKENNYFLNSLEKGLKIEPYTWREITSMSKSCIVIVNCDRPYEPDDYIHDFKKFKEICQTF
tara:strand:- start:1424 stop:1819 length:396 start_codon:yes stop_codon:yes gene_type:complete